MYAFLNNLKFNTKNIALTPRMGITLVTTQFFNFFCTFNFSLFLFFPKPDSGILAPSKGEQRFLSSLI